MHFRLSYASSNPAVYTDGYCFLDWIAEQYNMKVIWLLLTGLYIALYTIGETDTLVCTGTEYTLNVAIVDIKQYDKYSR